LPRFISTFEKGWTTGTVRENRVGVKNVLDKNAPRGIYAVQHEKNSGINFITIQDSKPVSILSTAADINPLSSVKRYDEEAKTKKELPFPNAFQVYNKHMDGVDIHDQNCSRVLPMFRSKKWTWVIFMRLIQAAVTNATVLWNTVELDNKRRIKEFALAITKHYLQLNLLAKHTHQRGTKRSYCSVGTCRVRSWKLCQSCDKKYFCEPCFKKVHRK